MTEKKNSDERIDHITYISLDSIRYSTNIRTNPNEDIAGLAASMKKFGQLVPIRVYEKGPDYIPIYGHRRCIAAKIANLPYIKAVIVEEPESVDKLYIQAIENEQSTSLSPEDREAYIHSLLENGESVEKVAQTTGISESYVRECSTVFEVRIKNQSLLTKAGMQFCTKDLYALRNADEDEAKEAIARVAKNPENKRVILEELNKRTKRKMNVGGKRKNKENAVSVAGDIKIAFGIMLDEGRKVFSVKIKKDVNFDEKLEALLLDVFSRFFSEKGYTSTDAP